MGLKLQMPAIFILVPNVPCVLTDHSDPLTHTAHEPRAVQFVGTTSERCQAFSGVPYGAVSLSTLREARSDETNEIASVKVHILLADNCR